MQELIDFEPFLPMRLTLASGDVIDLRRREGLSVTGLSLAIEQVSPTGRRRLRLVSLPNICLVEPIAQSDRDWRNET
jgi:hypothetical protein